MSDRTTELISIVLSSVVLASINIVIAGQLLGAAFNLPANENEGYFNIKIPMVLKIGARGKHATAGFCAFSVSLMIVAAFFSGLAREMFIDNVKATDSQWTASLLFAGIVSLIGSLVIGGLASGIGLIRSAIN